MNEDGKQENLTELTFSGKKLDYWIAALSVKLHLQVIEEAGRLTIVVFIFHACITRKNFSRLSDNQDSVPRQERLQGHGNLKPKDKEYIRRFDKWSCL